MKKAEDSYGQRRVVTDQYRLKNGLPFALSCRLSAYVGGAHYVPLQVTGIWVSISITLLGQ
jgi:hypothetical protein